MRTPSEWLQYYQQNLNMLLPIPWERGAELSSEEIGAIARSVQEFQVGESSEGHHLIQDARNYSTKTGDTFYLQTIRLFIAEEQRHARDLGRFLRLHGLPLVQTTFTDRVFRRLRNLFPGLELSIAVLVTAEVIAKVYYAALREATRSTILRTLCEQILRDEVSHVDFQTEQLARLRASRGSAAYVVTMALQRLLMVAAIVVVWISHRSVMRRGGMGRSAWWRQCWQEFQSAFSAEVREEARREATALPHTGSLGTKLHLVPQLVGEVALRHGE